MHIFRALKKSSSVLVLSSGQYGILTIISGRRVFHLFPIILHRLEVQSDLFYNSSCNSAFQLSKAMHVEVDSDYFAPPVPIFSEEDHVHMSVL